MFALGCFEGFHSTKQNHAHEEPNAIQCLLRSGIMKLLRGFYYAAFGSTTMARQQDTAQGEAGNKTSDCRAGRIVAPAPALCFVPEKISANTRRFQGRARGRRAEMKRVGSAWRSLSADERAEYQRQSTDEFEQQKVQMAGKGTVCSICHLLRCQVSLPSILQRWDPSKWKPVLAQAHMGPSFSLELHGVSLWQSRCLRGTKRRWSESWQYTSIFRSSCPDRSIFLATVVQYDVQGCPCPWIAYEYGGGMLASAKLDDKMLFIVANQVCEAVTHLHKRAMLHHRHQRPTTSRGRSQHSKSCFSTWAWLRGLDKQPEEPLAYADYVTWGASQTMLRRLVTPEVDFFRYGALLYYLATDRIILFQPLSQYKGTNLVQVLEPCARRFDPGPFFLKEVAWMWKPR